MVFRPRRLVRKADSNRRDPERVASSANDLREPRPGKISSLCDNRGRDQDRKDSQPCDEVFLPQRPNFRNDRQSCAMAPSSGGNAGAGSDRIVTRKIWLQRRIRTYDPPEAD